MTIARSLDPTHTHTIHIPNMSDPTTEQYMAIMNKTIEEAAAAEQRCEVLSEENATLLRELGNYKTRTYKDNLGSFRLATFCTTYQP